jgi:hypothetical protein
MFKIGVVEFDCGHDSGGATYGAQTVYRVEINPGSLAEANAMRWQMLGQKDKIVAVLWDDDPMVNGMYVQRDCSISPIANYLAHGRMSVNVVLERVEPEIEAHYEMTYFTGAEPTTFLAAAVHGLYDLDDFSSGSAVWDDSGLFFDGNLEVGDINGVNGYLPTAGLPFVAARQTIGVQQSIDPTMLDLGRARVEVNLGDEAGWWTLEGSNVPEGADIRVSNGLVRLTILAGTAYMSMEEWDTTGWVGTARYTLVLSPDGTPTFTPRWHVIKNERSEVYIRCTMTRGSSYGDRRKYAADVRVFRGIPLVYLTPSSVFYDLDFTSIAVEMSEYDGTGMATQVFDTTSLRRSTAISTGIRPYLFAGKWDGYSAPTASETTDTVTYATTRFAIFVLGGIDGKDYYETEYFLSDRPVR